MKQSAFLVTIVLNFLVLGGLSAQVVKEKGALFIQHFQPKEYGGSAQVWSSVQDSRGLMYFGDWADILEFDGREWTKIPNANNSIVRSLAADTKGRIYVGASNEFGFLHPNSQGKMEYVSLSQLLPENERNFLEIHRTLITSKGVFFVANRKVFIYQNNELSSININGMPFRAFSINDRIYVLQRNIGICELNDSILVPLKNTEWITTSILLPFSDEEILIINAPSDILLYNLITAQATPFLTQASEYINKHRFYAGVRIDNERFAIGTRSGGVIIINNHGEIEQIINEARGFYGTVYSLYVDNSKNLWATTNNGIVKVDINFPVLTFGEQQNVKDYVFSNCIHNNRRYIGTISGLYYLPDYQLNIPNDNHSFAKIDGFQGECWGFNDVNDILIGIGNRGLWAVQGSSARLLRSLANGYCATKNSKFPNSLFVGTAGGIEYIKFNNNPSYDNIAVVESFVLPEIRSTVRSIASDKDGNLWVGTVTEGIYYIRFFGISAKDYQVTQLGLQNDLRTLNHNNLSIVDDQIYVCNSFGIFSPIFPPYKSDSDSLIRFRYSDFWGENVKRHILQVIKVSDSRYFFGPSYFAEYKNNSFRLDSAISLRLSGHYDLYLSSIDEHKNISLGGSSAYFYINTGSHRDFYMPYNALLRKVTLNNDSLLFGGCFYSEKNDIITTSLSQTSEFKPILDYSYNSITFEFSALSFEEPQKMRFKYILEGFNKEWTSWSTDNKAVFTNLPEGKYTFKVKALNVYGASSEVAEYRFEILPPWHRTWWAVLIYIMLLIALIIVIVRVYTIRLVKQKEHLEEVVKERTSEINKQKEEIQQHNIDLQKKNKKIEDQSNQIIASINYAKRIQEAVLPDILVVSEFLPPHFILFRPRDIVSGDFYWIKKINNYVYITAADCTGHGVPGAFMSMLGTAFLNEISGHGKAYTPAQVLNNLRDKVKKSLKQVGKSGEAKDGMDMSLIRIDFERNELLFSGAYNPMVHIRKSEVDGSPIVTKLKGDRMPIGINIKETDFTDHIVPLLPNDMIYIYSDGFVDQIGGDSEKKFLSKNFVENLQEIYHLPCPDQKEFLDLTLDKWMEGFEQVDDILVIGICYKDM